jgi:prepilin-type processing-associated H-X9-DG protein
MNNNIKNPSTAVGRGPGSSGDLVNTVNGTNNWSLSVSDHPGGANVAKVDGSVVFLNDSINIDAYRWMIEIDDGQVIPD